MDMGDYYTKHHPSWHCIQIRPVVLNNNSTPSFDTGKGVLVTPNKGPAGPRNITVITTVKTQIQILGAYLTKFNHMPF